MPVTSNPLYEALARMLRRSTSGANEAMKGPVEDAVVGGAPKQEVLAAMMREAQDPERARTLMRMAGFAGPLRVVGQYGYSPQLFHGSTRPVPKPNPMKNASEYPPWLQGFYTSKSPEYSAVYGSQVSRYGVKPGTKVLEVPLSPVKMSGEDIERFSRFAESRGQMEMAKALRARDPDLVPRGKDYAHDMQKLIHEYAIANKIPISGIDDLFEMIVRDPSVLRHETTMLKPLDVLGKELK